MLAGWNVTPAGDDITGGRNNVSPAIPTSHMFESTAPISNEGAFVRNTYGGLIAELSQSTLDRMAVGAYSDLQQLGTRRQTAVLKRQYLLNANESFTRAIHVGYLDLVWVGQVQTEPTLIGFIEGAPPVPSENLTRPYYTNPGFSGYMRYLDTSVVTLSQQTTQELSFTSSSNESGSVDVSAAFGLFGQYNKTDLNLIAVETSGYYFKNSIQLQAEFHGQWGTEKGASYEASWNAAQGDSMGLSGDWEPFESDPEHYLNSQVGRRFVADNLGYALVESLTADLYATTFAATGAALGTIIVPNPQIPPDRNLLLFPIAPKYTKAETLDGKVGLVNAPGYPHADRFRGSFFKPVQGYALAHQIDRQNEQQRAFAAQFDAQGRGRAGQTDLGPAAKKLPLDFDTSPGDKQQAATPRSGIVNRSLWSADGGLHSETQSFSALSTRSYSGFRTLSGGGGISGSGEFYLGLGWSWALDAMGSYSLTVTTGSSNTVSQGLSLDVSLEGEAYLRAYDPHANAEYGDGKGAFSPGAAPGKVKQYRFMTLYLPPARQNSTSFDAIVDPEWKALSNDPTARALRELNSDNPAWRILHRVTYVERVPPPIASRPLFAASTELREPVNLDGNIALSRLVDASIDPSKPLTHVGVGDAVAAVLNPAPTGPGSYPDSILEQQVSWWRPFLDRARPDATGAISAPAAATELAQLVTRVYDYMYARYASAAQLDQ